MKAKKLSSAMIVLLCLPLLMLSITAVQAAALLVGSASVLGVEQVFSESHRVVLEGQRDVTQHDVILSNIKKVNGKWRARDLITASGALYEQTLEFRNSEVKHLKDELLEFVQQRGFDSVYDCRGLTCGRSHAWANVILENRLLTGMDATQHYWVWKGGTVWYTAYLIERGDRRIYLQWQAFTPESTSTAPETITDLKTQWQQTGVAVVERASPTKPEVQALTEWLAENNGSKRFFAVVGHNFSVNSSIAEQQSLALKEARLLSQELKSRFPTIVFKPYGIGPLAPRVLRGKDSYIEIVPLQE